MKHKAWLNNYERNFEQLAEDIGDLRYDTLSELLALLSAKIERDGIKDHQGGRIKLAHSLQQTAKALAESANHVQQAWQICEPYMFPKDITEYVKASFQKTEQRTVFQILTTFYRDWDSDTTFRLARCLLFGTNGNLEALNANVQLAHSDPRDIMAQAEYDEHMNRLRNFNRPFGAEGLQPEDLESPPAPPSDDTTLPF